MAAVLPLLRARAERWLFQLRDSEPGEVRLHQRRVFIVPTRAGLGFAVLVLLIFIGAINYSLGLGFALTFFMVACGLVGMVQTARNLALLDLAPGRAQPVFAGEQAWFGLRVINRSRLDRFAIRIDFLAAGAPRHVLDVAAGASAALDISAATGARGWMTAPRVRLLSRFPLGLFQAWSYWQPDLRVLVYPCPETAPPPLPLAQTDSAGDSGAGAGQDDFAGIRAYQNGDRLHHLAWRQIARFDPELGGPLVSKQFEGGATSELCLDLAALPATLDLELRLARMTAWVLDAEQRQLPYAMRLEHQYFAPALGPAQRTACLQALALYGQVARA